MSLADLRGKSQSQVKVMTWTFYFIFKKGPPKSSKVCQNCNIVFWSLKKASKCVFKRLFKKFIVINLTFLISSKKSKSWLDFWVTWLDFSSKNDFRRNSGPFFVPLPFSGHRDPWLHSRPLPSSPFLTVFFLLNFVC